MATYEITENGRLILTADAFGKLDKPEVVAFTGVIEFYNSNASAGAFGQLFTAEGEDFESVTYEATFSSGEVVGSIVETERERHPALSSAFYREADKVVDADAPEFNTDEPEVGAILWRAWGGDSAVYPVTLLAKTDREWALSKDGRIESGNPSDLGRLLFHTQAEAETEKAWRKDSGARKTQWCADRLAEKVTGTIQTEG